MKMDNFLFTPLNSRAAEIPFLTSDQFGSTFNWFAIPSFYQVYSEQYATTRSAKTGIATIDGHWLSNHL